MDEQNQYELLNDLIWYWFEHGQVVQDYSNLRVALKNP